MGVVKYGIKNLHVAVLTTTVTEGVTSYSYGTPILWPGAVSLNIDQGGNDSFFAADDNARFFNTSAIGPKTGTLETAVVPQSVLEAVFSDTVDGKGVIFQSTADPKEVAILGEYRMGGTPVRFVIYRAVLSRPALGSSTIADSVSPVTEPVNVTMLQRDDGKTAARTTAEIDATTFAGWFGAVYEYTAPTQQSSGGGGG